MSSISSRDQFVFHIIFISRASLTFPEVQNRKGTENGLNIHNAFTNIVISFSKKFMVQSTCLCCKRHRRHCQKKGGKNCRRGQVALMQCKNKWGILILKGIGSPDVHCTMFFADLCEIRNTLNVIFNFSQYQKLQLNFFAPWHKKSIFSNSHNL